ncbi:PREDICTED: leucine rich adaptor protein 1-like [Pygoscelis adeliae]|nr:PREDICTED: leucine rich adaptor protein 1-like [Pygoscelis adeliae]
MPSQSPSNGYIGKTKPMSFMSTTLYGREYRFGQFWSTVPDLSSPNIFPSFSLLAEGAEWKTEKALMLCNHCSARAETLVNLRATDVKLMRQLLIINESIESIKWMIEEKAIASRGSSLSGSLCSLLESQETSLHGSCNSLQDCSDGLDGISVGSYLDTLVDDVPGHQTPSDMDQFSDSSIMEDSQPLHKHPKIDSDEYYCFG